MVKKPYVYAGKFYKFIVEGRVFTGKLEVDNQNPKHSSGNHYSVTPEGSEYKIRVFFRGKNKIRFNKEGTLVQIISN